ncbi:MAG: SH3 domain-containing protein, partial [Bacteroidales bacterium]|nr:SH3 domain-containing protein [Bacteroidales bacterium]
MKFFLVILFCLISIYGFSQEEIDQRNYGKITIGESQYLLFDKVNLRSHPYTDSEIVKNLPIGSLMKIIGKSDSSLTLNGYSHNWYQVSQIDENNKEIGVQGYLWGGFFAENLYETENDPEVRFLYGLAKMKKTEWGEVPVVQVRAIISDKEIAQVSFEAIGSLTTYRNCELLGNKGIRNINEIIHFNFSDDFCGGAFGDVYIFWDKAILHHARTLHSGADAPVFSDESFIFPEDEGGKEGRIIFNESAGEDGDEGTVYDYQRTTDLI